MPHRTDHLRKSRRGEQGKSPRTRRAHSVDGDHAVHGVHAGLAGLAVLATLALAGCVNSNLLDPPPLFTTRDATRVSTDCDGGGKGETPTTLTMCADINISTGSPVMLTIYSPFNPTNPNGTPQYPDGTIPATLVIINREGAIVRHLIDEERPTPGYFLQEWDMLDDAGIELPSGDYRLYLKVSNQTTTGDVTLYR